MVKKKYHHRKLVRDKIPDIIKKTGDDFEARILTDIEYVEKLKDKLVEETREVVKAGKDDILGELADILELIKSLSRHYKISFRQVEQHRLEKKRKRGGFSKRIFLIWSTGKSGR